MSAARLYKGTVPAPVYTTANFIGQPMVLSHASGLDYFSGLAGAAVFGLLMAGLLALAIMDRRPEVRDQKSGVSLTSDRWSLTSDSRALRAGGQP